MKKLIEKNQKLLDELQKSKRQDHMKYYTFDEKEYKFVYEKVFALDSEFKKFAEQKVNSEYKTVLEQYSNRLGFPFMWIFSGGWSRKDYIGYENIPKANKFICSVWQYILDSHVGYIPDEITGTKYCNCPGQHDTPRQFIFCGPGYVVGGSTAYCNRSMAGMFLKATNMPRIKLTDAIQYADDKYSVRLSYVKPVNNVLKIKTGDGFIMFEYDYAV